MKMRREGILALICMASAATGGWTGPAGGGFQAEVDAYEHGVMRLRLREDGKTKYEVTDVVVEKSLETVQKEGDVFSSGGSKLQLKGTGAEFQGAGGAINFQVTKDNHEDDAIEATSTFPTAERLYGIPEHAVDMSLQEGKSYRLMNLDVYMYKLDDTGGIYGSKPFMHAHGAKGTVGFFWLNSADSSAEISKPADGWTSKWSSKGGIYDTFFLPGPTPQDVLRQYSYITGKMALHPLFSLGYHQCRWNYRSEEDTLQVDEGFDKHYIPYDVIWLDIEHTDGKKYFTWDAHNFPNPEKMINTIASKGRKVVTISDPHIKRAAGYHVHDTATANNYYVKTESGADYEGHCWPGQSSWLDYYSEKVRNWYATLFRYDMYPGSTPDLYTWIDMNEPSVFNSPEVTMDMNAVHTRDDGFKAKHRDLHNMYGFYQTMAAYQGLYERTLGAPHKTTSRPFILSRSFFSGSQRYAAVWTGDNAAEWSHLDKSVPMLLSMSLAGLPFVGADVGGFFNNPEPELLVRWYQLGTFYPFFRGHAHLETKRREPWLFGEDNTDSIRRSIVRRYQLMPFIYTQFFRAHLMGESVIMPLYFAFPSDPKVLDIDRQLLLGECIMAKPVVAAGITEVTMYLPGADPWFNLYTGAAYAPGGDITLPAPLADLPALVRGGYIIPKRERVRRSTSAQFWDPVTLLIAVGKDGSAKGDLYLDDSHSFEYQQGAFVHKQYTFENGALNSKDFATDSVYASKFASTKTFETAVTVERVVFYGLADKPNQATVTLGGTSVAAGMTWDSEFKTLTIRKPGVKVSADWTISFAGQEEL
eukprot:TRINITY_DN11026_c0_g5_i1.p1 TRINITY_DN11026_c0_g5~~TRINITY_DN11026_c0_g5_i1.p1  ORF type:complete len:813 (+),score=228.51 TRINITY_DN11026_c0_g5_i1:43-2481(+)